MTNKDFVIENGVLIKYNGKDENVVIPDGVKSIDYDAFEPDFSEKEIKEKEILTITVPKSVEELSFNSFECYTLTDIIVASQNPYYKSIDGILYTKDEKVLIRCPMGKKGAVDISKKVKVIGKRAFEQCYALTDVTLHNVEEIGEFAFADSMVSSLVVPKTVQRIGAFAFGYESGFTIVAPADSCAIEYAKENNLKYIEK